MTIDNKRLALLEGKNPLPEEVSTGGMFYRSPMRSITIPPPDYSTSPADRGRLWEYLMGKEEMWNSFLDWSVKQYWRPQTKADRGFFPWLSLPLDGVPRWVSLLSEWLGMEETREKFGQSKCKHCEDGYALRLLGGRVETTNDTCQHCDGTGKIRAEWAR